MEEKATSEQSNYASWSPQGSGYRWSGPPTPSSVERRCKAAEAVLEEVEEKGSLVERVSELEKRVLKVDYDCALRSLQLKDNNAQICRSQPDSAHS